MARIAVRQATVDDLEVLVILRRGMFESMGVGDTASRDQQDRDFRQWVRPRLRRGEYVGFVAWAGKEAVAGAAVWLCERQPAPGFPGGRLPYLLSVYTAPRFRGRGLATRTIKAAMTWCRHQGYRSMTLHASPQARGLYARLGWERTWQMRVEL